MKTTEQKAKKYDEALEWMRKLYPGLHGATKEDAEHYFPELKEGKDERIIEQIKFAVMQMPSDREDTKKECLAYLEKQKYDRMKPIYDADDFTIYHPLKNGNGKYECIPYSFYGSLTSFSDNRDLMDFINGSFYDKEECERWCEIENESELPECKHKIKKESELDCLCESPDGEKQKESPKSADSIPSDCVSDAKCENLHNEEGDFVFELRQIISSHRYSDIYGEYINDEEAMASEILELCKCELEKQKEQKPITINQDEKEFLADEITAFLCNYDKEFDGEDPVPSEVAEHFYLLGKQAQEQKQAEWSEEDETRLTNILIMLKEYVIHHYSKDDVDKSVDWLENRVKFLRPQSKDEIYKEKNEAFKLGKHQLAIKFMNYLDENRPEGKMSLSNGECEDIDKAFKENDWAKIIQYVKKYQIQAEQKPAEVDEYKIIKKHITEDSLSSEVNKRLTECGWYVTDEKPVEWSEEDEMMLIKVKQIILKYWDYHKYDDEKKDAESCYNWLKSLKDRGNFPKSNTNSPSEWSEDIVRRGIKEVGLTQHQIDWLKNNVFPPKEEQEPETKLTGWVARDKEFDSYLGLGLIFFDEKPRRSFDTWSGEIVSQLPWELFPDLKWEDEPVEVEVTIRRK